MIVAPAIEVMSTGAALPGRDLSGTIASGKTRGFDGLDTNAASHGASLSPGVQESFRARWQALLADLGEGTKGSEVEGASGAGSQQAAAASKRAAMGNASPAASLPGGIATSRRTGASVRENGLPAASGAGAPFVKAQGTGTQETKLFEASSVRTRFSSTEGSKLRSHPADSVRKHRRTRSGERAGLDTAPRATLSTPNPWIAPETAAAAPVPANPAGSAAERVGATPGRALSKSFSGQRSIPQERLGASGISGPAVKRTNPPAAGAVAGPASSGAVPEGHIAPDARGSEAKDVSAPNAAPQGAIQAVSVEAPQAFDRQSADPVHAQPHESGDVASPLAASGDVPEAISSARGTGPARLRAQSLVAGVAGIARHGEGERARPFSPIPREDSHREEPAAGLSADASSVLARDLTGTHEPAQVAGGSSAAASTAGGDPAHAAFSALDADPGMATPSWIHGSAHHAEAGFQDPALGWIGVRAELSGGNVHASLVPGSADAAQVLGGQIAGLHTYLAEHHAPVANITIAAPEGQDAGWSAGQGMNHGAGQNPGQGAQAQSHSDSRPGAPVPASAPSQIAARSGGTEAILPARRGGAYISVLA